MAHRRHVAVFPGSFDPVTFGHLDVVERGRALFDEIVIGVGRNPAKQPLFSVDERVAMIEGLVRSACQARPEGAPVRVEAFDGLTVDFARSQNASALLRGIRNLQDLQYEIQQAITNREVAGLETAFVIAGQGFAYTSSSLIRQLTALGEDLDESLKSMVPVVVIEALKSKKAAGHPMLAKLSVNDG